VTSVTTMYSCLNCHEMNQAKTACDTCHKYKRTEKFFSSGGIMAKPIELEINGKRYPGELPCGHASSLCPARRARPDRQQVRLRGRAMRRCTF